MVGREDQMKVSSQAWLAILVTLELKGMRNRGSFPSRTLDPTAFCGSGHKTGGVCLYCLLLTVCMQ